MRIAVLAFSLVLPCIACAEPVDALVNARTIERFKIGSSTSVFGRLEFVGGLELTSGNPDFGAISAFRFIDGETRILSISDNGFWIAGMITRDPSKKPLGFEQVKIAEMSMNGRGTADMKWLSDAEGLLVDGDKVSVSFERDHRISTGTLDRATFEFTSSDEPLPVPAKEIRSNRGFETLAKSPFGSALQGARVAITEKSLNADRNIYAGIMDSPDKGIFYIRRNGAFDITDGDFLPNGDLLLLERKFSIAEGIGMRIRKIDAAALRAGATVDGPVLLEADLSYQIDNMEGLDVWQRSDGATMISLMSDDNHSILQRNLYLEFRLLE